MKPKLLPVIALTASLLLAMSAAWADGAADGGDLNYDARIYNGKEYILTRPPSDADLTQSRPSNDQLRRHYANCYRNGAPFGTPTSTVLRTGQTSLWQGWYCPSTKPSPTPGSDTNPTPSPQPNPQPNPKPNPNNPKGCGSMVNGKWVEVPCDFDKKTDPQPTPAPTPTPTEPTVPTIPTVPKVPDIPDTEELRTLKKALEELSKQYQSKFNSLRDEAIVI